MDFNNKIGLWLKCRWWLKILRSGISLVLLLQWHPFFLSIYDGGKARCAEETKEPTFLRQSCRQNALIEHPFQPRTKRYKTVFRDAIIMHLSMLSPRGEGPRRYVGHLTSIAFPTLGNLTKNLGTRVGTFASFARRNGTKSQRPMCSSVRRPYWWGNEWGSMWFLCWLSPYLPVWRLREFQSGLVPPANNLCPIDDHGHRSSVV